MDFEVIASSSGGCCYILCSGNLPPLILDAGVKFSDIQKAMGYATSDAAGVLVTHAHGDHSKAVKNFLAAAIEVYASKECWDELGISSYYGKPLVANESRVIEGWIVLPFTAVHDSPGTLGFMIGDGMGNRALYLTDSAYSPHRFENLTHIYVECNYSREIMHKNTASGAIDQDRFRRTVESHMSLETLLDLLKANDMSKVREIHLLHLSDANSDEVAFADAVRETTGKPVYIAAKRVTA